MTDIVTVSGTCPQCGAALALRHRLRDMAPFIGCEGYPECRYISHFEPVLQQLHERLAWTEQQLALARQQLARRTPQPGTVDPQALDRELRQLAALVHPDRWHGHSGTEAAEEACKAALALRDRVQRGRL